MKALIAILTLAGLVAAGPLAVVIRTEGVVEMGSPNRMKTAKIGELVRSEWIVRTGVDGRARLRLLADQTLIDLAGGSTLELRSILRHDRALRRAYLVAGEATIQAGDQSDDLRVETQTTVSSTVGGQFGMSVKPDGQTTVRSTDGVVKVCIPETGDHERLPAGMTLTSTWDGIISTPTLLPPVTVVAPVDTVRKDSLMELRVRLEDPATGKSSVLRYRFKVER